MTVSYPISNLLKDIFRLLFSEHLPLLNKMIKISTASIFHHHHYVLFIFKDLKKPNDVRMSDLFEDVDLLEYFLS